MSRMFLVILVSLLVACQGQEFREPRVRHPQLAPLEEQVRRTLENAKTQWREQLDTADLPAVRAQAYARLGQVYLAHHFSEAAADALAFATGQSPLNPHWQFYYAKALERSFQLEDAEQALSASLDLENHAEVRFLRAQVRARTGDTGGALADLEQLKSDVDAQQENPDESAAVPTPATQAAWYALEAELYSDQRSYRAAEKSLLKALQLEPEANALYGPLMVVQHRLGESRSARAQLRKSGSRHPVPEQPLMQALTSLSRGAQYYLDRGREWMAARNFEQAVADFSAAADIAPSSLDARIAYARSLEIVGRVDVAEQQYVEALKLQPDSSLAHYFLGALYERQRQDELARRHYADALEADASYLPPRLSLAHALFRNREFEEALVHYAFYADARNNDHESRYYAGLAALARGDCDAAPAWFQQAVSVNSHSRAAQEGIARSFAVCSDDPSELSRAQDIGERLEEEQPDASAAATLAMVHAALNDFESAVRLQNLAIRRSNEERMNGQRDRLMQYESGTRAQLAWLTGDPVFEPPRLAMRVLH